jgi:anti-sigma B factor antagonist
VALITPEEPASRSVVEVERSTPAAVVLRLHGEIDMCEGPELREAVIWAISQRPARLVIDLTDVEFFGTTGISVLVEASTQHADLRLVCPRLVSRSLAFAGLSDWFCISASVAEALADPPTA